MKLKKLFSIVLAATLTVAAMGTSVFAESDESDDILEMQEILGVEEFLSPEEFTEMTGIVFEVLDGDEAEEYLSWRTASASAFSTTGSSITFQSSKTSSSATKINLSNNYAQGTATISGGATVYSKQLFYAPNCNSIGMDLFPEDENSGTVTVKLVITVSTPSGLVGTFWTTNIKTTEVTRVSGDISDYELTGYVSLNNGGTDSRSITVSMSGN